MMDIYGEMPLSSHENVDVGREVNDVPTHSEVWGKYDCPYEQNTSESLETSNDVCGPPSGDSWAGYDKPMDQDTEKMLSQTDEFNGVYDDNGRLYMRDGEIIPSNEYDINGYHYSTDDQGRITKAEGIVQIPENKEPRAKLPEIKDAKETDDKGHLFAHVFGGADNKGNLVPMDSELNRHGDYRKCEIEVEQAIKEGKEVSLTVECEYADNARPTSFVMTIEIDGDVSERTFLNK